jgi:predicted Fe-S protein YdhL (DUF1289 family)
VNVFGAENLLKINGDGVAWSVEMNKKGTTSPCTNICRYEEIDGEPRCISCFRTYEDLSQWIYLSDEDRRERIKQIKKDRREYERQQKNSEDMGKES